MSLLRRSTRPPKKVNPEFILVISVILNCFVGLAFIVTYVRYDDLKSSQAVVVKEATNTQVVDTDPIGIVDAQATVRAEAVGATAQSMPHRFSTPIHLTVSGPDFLLDREGRIGYADLERELEACGATGLTFSHEAENFDVAKDADADETNLEISTLAGVFPDTKGNTRFEIRTELEPPAADEHSYRLTTTVVFKDKGNRCFTATRERMCLFEEFEPAENADSGLFPTVLFYDEAKGIMLTEDQANALKWAAMNFLPSKDEVDAPKSESWFTDPVMAINLPAISDYLVHQTKIKS